MPSSPAVAEAVKAADLVLDIGGMQLFELNTGLWTDLPDPDRASRSTTTGCARGRRCL